MDGEELPNVERRDAASAPFQRVRRKPVIPSPVSVVKTGHLGAEEALPLVVEANADELDLTLWTKGNVDFIEKSLLRYGAILFRGFEVGAASDFEQFFRVICPDLFRENGEHPRETVTGGVYTPVSYPSDQLLLWHNENSFNHSWPMKISFCCMKPAEAGGETPIVDSRKVYQLLDAKIRERFVEKKIMYVRNYENGLGLNWETIFRTDDRTQVEEQCRRDLIEFEWKEGGGLRTRCVRPAVIKHPQTGEMSWFNQAQHWHISCLGEAVQESLLSLFAEEDLPRNCYYGDGSRIEASVMDEILGAYRELAVSFPWRKADIMLLDNVLTAHGRHPYAGERKLFVSMGEMRSYDES